MMHMMRDWLERLRYALRGAREADDLREEMAYHREQETAENMRAGMSAEEAARAAAHKFGSADVHAEATRDASGAAWILDLMQDIRLALRGLRRTRASQRCRFSPSPSGSAWRLWCSASWTT